MSFNSTNKSLVVWIFQTGEPLHIDGKVRGMRGMNFADALVKAGHQVVFFSSRFSHQTKTHRVLADDAFAIAPRFKIRLIDSPGYKKNISLSRLWDHLLLALNLRNALSSEQSIPDIVFIGFPPIESAAVFARWSMKRNIPFIIDVKDQWPDIFINAIPYPFRWIGLVVFMPYFYLAKYAVRKACGVTAMTASFLGWACEKANRKVGRNDRVVPLTTRSEQSTSVESDEANTWWDCHQVFANDIPKFCFVGSHSASFDFEPIFLVAERLAHEGVICQFIICGSGTESQRWRDRCKNLDNVIFPGWINHPQAKVLASRSLATIAPYKNTNDFMMSVPNKIIDSLSMGLPIISSLDGEVYRLIDQNKIGFFYNNDDELYVILKTVIDDPLCCSNLSKNAKELYDRDYAFDEVYDGLVQHIECLVASGESSV